MEKVVNGKTMINSGKRYATVVVGAASSGYTANDVDYLCTGTNDNVVIQNAIDSLPANGGSVFLLGGTYVLGDTISISDKNNIKIYGTGEATKIDYSQYGTQEFFIELSWCNNIKIENIHFTSSDSEQRIYAVFDTQSGQYLKIKNCRFSMPAGIIRTRSTHNITIDSNIYNTPAIAGINSYFMIKATSSRHVLVTNNIINCILPAWYDVINLEDAENFLISNNTIKNTSSSSSTSGNNGVKIIEYNGVEVGNSIISGNSISGLSTGIITEITNTLIYGNTLTDNGIGINLKADRCTVNSNNIKRGNGTAADYTSSQQTISITRSTNSIVGNNLVLGKDVNSVSATNCLVVDNVVSY